MTIKEIADLAGVSISTVSKIINNKDDNINLETRNRVLKIVKEYNYVPYASVINSSTAKSFLIGVILKSASQSNSIVNGLMEIVQKNGYHVLLCDSKNSKEEEYKNIISLQNSHVDGIIWEAIDASSLEHEKLFIHSGIPIQYMSSTCIENSKNIDFVKMGYAATECLLKVDHTNIACLVKPGSTRSDMVLEGFKKCLFDYKISYRREMVFELSDFNFYSSLLSNHFTAVVSSHFALALAFYEQFSKLQYRIPEDFSLISLRDSVRENISFPQISYIKIPYKEFGMFLGNQIIQKCEAKEYIDLSFNPDFLIENSFSIDFPCTSKSSKIVVIGSLNIDITLNVEDLPQPGKTVITNKSSISPGGKGANQAIGIAKLEHSVSLIGRVGNDYEASIIYTAMSENHINAAGIKRDMSAETGKAYIHVQSDGESTISILTGANENLSPSDIHSNKHLFDNCSFCLLQTEIPLPTVIEAAKTARSLGVQTILKPAALKSINRELLQYISFFIPNEKEASLLCPDKNTLEEKADFFLSNGANTVIITLGHNGCFVKNRELCRTFPAIHFTPVDTTGAADAFISALSVYLTENYSLEKAVTIASYAAGFSINRQGVIPALIDRKSLEIYIKKQNPDLLS